MFVASDACNRSRHRRWRKLCSHRGTTMDRWHNYYPDGHAYFCTATVSDWRPLLKGEAIDILWQEWEKARQALDVKVLAYCVMPEHIHVVLWSEIGKNAAKFLHRILAQTSRHLQPGGGFWKERPRVLPIHSRNVLKAKVDYIHRNPIRRELVANAEDWEYSSFRQIVLGAHSAKFVCDEWGLISI